MAAPVDLLVVGAGLSGATVAERLAEEHGLEVVVLERRAMLGGMAHDARDAAGVLVHTHGPHWFRTDDERVERYVTSFVPWRPLTYRVQAFAEGRYWPFPVSLDTFEALVGRAASSAEMEAWLATERVPNEAPKNSEELVLATAGRRFYELFFRGYTRKMWGVEPAELPPEICGRIPVRTTRDDRWVSARFQALPEGGYTRLVERMLTHPRIEVRLGTDLSRARPDLRSRHLVYTGELDEYFGRCHGPLPYRTLRFARKTVPRSESLPALQVNYPGDEPTLRAVDYARAEGGGLEHTTVVRDQPAAAGPGDEPYYPLPAAAALADRYRALAAAERDVTFLGRLATYRYLNMDQCIAEALAVADGLSRRLRSASRRTARSRSAPAVDVEVVVARCRESVQWTRNLPRNVRVTLYDKGHDLDPRAFPTAHVVPLDNVGREAHTYLWHLSHRYDDLAEVTLFCQGHPFDHAADLHRVVRDLAAGRERVEEFRWLGFIIDTDDERGRRLFVNWSKNPEHRELAVDRFCALLFGEPATTPLRFFPGAQFVVRSSCARTRPQSFYERALALSTTFPDAAHCFERLWDRVFGVVGVDPALLGGEPCRYLKPIRRLVRPDGAG